MKLQLIPDWRESWQYYSQIGIAVIGAVSGVAAVFVDSLLAAKIILVCNVGLAAVTHVGRIVEQTGLKPVVKHDDPDPVA